MEGASVSMRSESELQVPRQDVEVDVDDQLTDNTRNWSPDVLLELVKIWRREVLAHPNWSRAQRMQNVFDAFRQTVDCSSRSRKAVDDKLYSMKQMYQFIARMNSHFMEAPKTNLPSWFELNKDERRAVRSLHRIRIPDISLDVYTIFDSVLNPTAVAARKAKESNGGMAITPSQTTIGEGANGKNSAAASATLTTGTISTEETQEILDVKRNWSYDVTLQLARVWNNVHKENPALRGATLSLNVYNAFMANVGGSNRSRKAVDDKMHSMKEMYRFMKAYETARLAGADKIPWFDLTKPQRRAIRAENKIRVPNLAPDVYNEIDMLMTRMNQVSPVEGAVEPSTSVPPAELGDNRQNSASFPTASFGTSSASMNRLSSNSRVVSSATNVNGQSGQNTCECGAKRTLHETPASAATSVQYSGHSDRQMVSIMNRQAIGTGSVTLAQSAFATRNHQDQGAPKRQRITQDHASGAGTDTQTAQAFMEQLQSSLAQDREERRQQHAEQMSILREIATLLKQGRRS